MTGKAAAAMLAVVAFLMVTVSGIFALCMSNEELFVKYRHWLRPTLLMAAIAWFFIFGMMVFSMKQG